MPVGFRRQRARQEPEASSEEQNPRDIQRRRLVAESQDEEEEDEDDDEEEDGEDGEAMQVDRAQDEDSPEQLVKKLVRYALACEYQRIPIRRTGISEKVLGGHPRAFKRTFESAQRELRFKFGMQMVELPAREKVTLKERRAASAATSNSKTTSSYILVSTLPLKYRESEILPPSLIGNASDEAAYVGLCTFIVSVIALSPLGAISDEKLVKHLSRVHADKNTPVDKTENVLAKMIKQGYLYRTTERNDGEEKVEWRVGPRGKIEIGHKGVQGFVQEVYGEAAPTDLENRLRRSLGIEMVGPVVSDGEEEVDDIPVTEAERSRRVSERRR